MKKIILASLCVASALSFTGCVSEEDDIFSASAPVRLEETAETYTQRLSAATSGWAMEYYPTSELTAPKGQGYLLLAKFMPNLSVTVGMKNQFSTPANQYMEDTSSWEIITDNGPVLTFDTYNDCIHTFSSPEDVPSTSTDETGVGLEGDYEFVMIDVPEDGEFVMLKGKKRGTYTRLTRLDEGTDFKTYIEDIQAFNEEKFSASYPNMCVITLGDSIMKMANSSTGICSLFPYNGDQITDVSYHPFLITKRGGKYYLRFRDALNAPDGSEAQEFVYNSDQDIFTGVENENFTIEGDEPNSFFISAMDDGYIWRLTKTSQMSNELQTSYEALRTGFSSQGYTLNYIEFIKSDGQLQLAINFKYKQSNLTATYSFAGTQTENGYTLNYEAPAGAEISSNLLKTIPEIQEFLSTISAEYTVTANTTKFNLSEIKFFADENKWFVLTIE